MRLTLRKEKKSSTNCTMIISGGTTPLTVADRVADRVANGSTGEIAMNTGRASLLTISLTVNCCTLSFFALRACLNQLILCKVSFCRRGTLTNLAKLHRDNQWMLPKILVDQLLSWALIVIGVMEMARGDILDNPFVPKASRDLTLSGTAFCMNIGKYVYKMAQDTILVKHVKRFKADMLHHAVTVSCYAVFQAYSENILLGLVGLLMESDLIWRDIGGISKRANPDKKSCFYKGIVVLGAVATIISRGVLPIAFVTLALFAQPLTQMHFAPIIFLFLSLIFFLAVNVWLVVKAAMRMRNVYQRKLQPVADLELTEVASIGSHIHPTGNGTSAGIQRPLPTGHPIPLSVKNDLSYLRAYANTNIANNAEDAKLNLMNRKTLCKPMVGNFRQVTVDPHLNNNNNTNNYEYVTQTRSRTVSVASQESAESSPRSNSSAELYSVGQNLRIGYINIETRANETGHGVHHVVVSDDCQQQDTNRPLVPANS